MNLFNNKGSYLALCILGVVAAVVVTAVILAPERGETALYFLDIGQGDSELIELPGGIQLLIDGGPGGAKLLANLDKVLAPTDRYIDLVLMTHPQLDHFGGFIDLLKNYEIGALVGTGRKGTTAGYEELRRQLEVRHTPYITLAEGDRIAIGDAMLEILAPSRTELLSGELNDTALAFRFSTPSLSALYTADIGINIEERLVEKYGASLDVDVLKVGHHGSRFSSGESFLAAVTPSVAVIEVGKNTYGHPTKQALERLTNTGARILRTDQDGVVKIVSADGRLKVFTTR